MYTDLLTTVTTHQPAMYTDLLTTVAIHQPAMYTDLLTTVAIHQSAMYTDLLTTVTTHQPAMYTDLLTTVAIHQPAMYALPCLPAVPDVIVASAPCTALFISVLLVLNFFCEEKRNCIFAKLSRLNAHHDHTMLFKDPFGFCD